MSAGDGGKCLKSSVSPEPQHHVHGAWTVWSVFIGLHLRVDKRDEADCIRVERRREKRHSFFLTTDVLEHEKKSIDVYVVSTHSICVQQQQH